MWGNFQICKSANFQTFNLTVCIFQMIVVNAPVPVTINTIFSKLTIISFLPVFQLQTTTRNLNDATFKNRFWHRYLNYKQIRQRYTGKAFLELQAPIFWQSDFFTFFCRNHSHKKENSLETPIYPGRLLCFF